MNVLSDVARDFCARARYERHLLAAAFWCASKPSVLNVTVAGGALNGANENVISRERVI
jgi:hypothetical protein